MKKVKPEEYFGKRIVDGFIYDFDTRVIHHIESKSEDGMYLYDRLESQPMMNMNDYKGIFINKKYPPIIGSNMLDTSDTPLFEEHQRKGVDGEFIKNTPTFLGKYNTIEEEAVDETKKEQSSQARRKIKIITRIPRASSIQKVLDNMKDDEEAAEELRKRCIKVIKDYEGPQSAKSASIFDDDYTLIEKSNKYREYNEGALMYIDALMEYIYNYEFREDKKS